MLIEEAAYAQLESNKLESADYAKAVEELAAAELAHEKNIASIEKDKADLKEKFDNKELSTC